MLVVVDRVQKDTFSTVEWAKKIKPRAYGRRLVALNDLVFEWDPKRLKSDSNPGYGVAVGRVVDPHGATLTVEWRDGETTTIARSNVRPAPRVNSKHGHPHWGCPWQAKENEKKHAEVTEASMSGKMSSFISTQSAHAHLICWKHSVAGPV